MTAQRLRHLRSLQALRYPLLAFALALGCVFALFAGCGLSTGGVPPTEGGDAGTACTAAGQCNDGNPCTTDVCGEGGICVHTAMADGPLPAAEQTPGNCKALVCMGGEPMTENDDTNKPTSNNPCVVEECAAGTPQQNLTMNDGMACVLNGNPAACNNGVCTVACKQASDCANTNPCQIPSCDGATGTCTSTDVPDGTPTPGITQPMGNCKTQVCVGGMNTAEDDDSNVPPIPTAMAGCADALCDNGMPSNPLHAVDSGCSKYMGNMPGFCDAAGSCAQCTKDSECPGTSDDCGHPACTNNACSMDYTASGTPTVSDPLQLTGTCKQIVCDGSGGHMTIDDDTGGAVPSSGTVCITDSCSNGSVVMTPNPGTVCVMSSMEKCSTTGQCGCQSNADCTLPQTCGGGGMPLFCGCTPATCSTLDKTCGGPFADGCGNMLNCNDNATDGTETDKDCGGAATANSTCASTCPQGDKCKVNSDCTSGFCADVGIAGYGSTVGVCCNVACTGLTCQACSAAGKGQGSDGVCGSVVLGQDPNHNCSNQGAASCMESGGCNGSSACSTYAPGTTCAPAVCANATVITLAETCNSSMMCKPPAQPTQDCTPFLCSGGACTTSCTSDAGCAASAYCSTAAGANHDKCLPKFSVGAGTCSAADQCASPGICGTNGVCCAATCSVTNPPCGQTGACAPSTGLCLDAASGTACTNVVSCTNGAMSGVLLTDTTCNGTGNCSTGGTMANCTGNATCSNGTTCNNGCGGNDGKCVSGYYCSGTTCTTQGVPGATCSANDQCASNKCGTTGSGHCCSPSSNCTTGGTCGAIGCDGSGNCVYPTGSCGTASCNNGSYQLVGSCSGGSCNTGSSGTCANDLGCNGTACATTCTPGTSTGCVSGSYTCNSTGTACLLSSGQSCSSNNACLSGVCGISGSGNCCKPGGCNTGGTCGATGCDGGGNCQYPGGSCGSATCSGDMYTAAGTGTCSMGNCSPGSPTTCGSNLTCSGNMCGTTCTAGTPTGCASSAYTCDSAGTACQLASGQSCSSNGACYSGICGVGGTGNCCVAGGCNTDGGGSCGVTSCASGTGACNYPTGSCSATPFCSSTTQVTQYTTCSNGSCTGGANVTTCLGMYLCQSSASPPACGCGTDDANGDNQCAANTWCDGTSNGDAGACQAPQATGMPCNRASQCLSAQGCNTGAGMCH